MASNEDTGSPGWGASLFMQTTEDVARAVAAAAATARSPRPSVVFTSKEEHADNPLSKLRSRFSRVLKSLTSPTTDTNSINYNPEVLTSQKRQWANFQLQYLDHRAWREPTRLFESMVVVGLHPNCNLQALQGQYISRKSEGSGILQGSLGGQNQSRIEPVIEPQVLFVYPPEKRLPLKYKDLLSFCFPGGVEVHAVERTPSMSELNEILLGQGHLKQSDLSFVFRLQVADDSTLYGCCMLVEEIVQKPSELLSMILEEQPASSSLGRYSRFVLTTRRCYCILSRLPFFELHFGVLNSIFTEERLQRLTKSINVLGFESQDEFCNEEDVDENVDYISVNYKDTKVAGSEKLDVSQSSVGASLPHRVPHDDHQPEHQSVETIEDTEDAVSETLDVSLSSVRASTPDSVPHDGHHPEHQGVERLEDTEDLVSGKLDVSQPNVRASIPDSVPHDGHHPEHQGVERLEDTEDAVSEKLDVSQSNVIALIPDRVPHDGHHLEHKGVEGLEDTENALSEKLDVPQYSVRASIPDSVPHDGHHPEHQGGERIERIEDTEDALSEKLDVPQYSVRASIPDSIPHDGHHLERQDVERIEDTEDAVSEKLDVSLSSVRASIPDCVPHDGHHPEHQGIERREDTGDAVSENLDVLQSSARASIPSVPHDCHQPEHQGDERLEDLPKETVYNNAIPINSESDVVPTVQVSVGANIQDCGRDNLMSNNQAGESRLPSAVLSLFCYYNSDIPESSSSFQDSLVDERNFRGNHDESGAEGASVSGQEDSDYLVEILEWAKANNRNSLLILCDYYSLHCPARGSKLRFHPLDHLHSLEYHRPDATVLNVAGSTINVQSCSTSLEFVEAQCALLAEEEAAALSTWAVACMCGSLRLEHVLTIFAGALLEKQIVVVCSNLGILSALVLSIVPLIRPYRWQSLLMPVLPNDMLDFLDAPVPYIVGVKNKTSEVQSKLTNVILVDASKNQVKSPTVPQLPRQRELFSSLSPYHAKLVGESFLARKRPVYECTDVQVEAARGFLGVVRSYLDSLCSNLRSHTITNVQSNNDKVSLLLKESFIDSFPSRDRPFMKLFVDTQLFSVHTDLALSFFQKE